MKELQVSQVAEQSGVGRETLRYYEAQGLIHATRNQNGFRSYRPDVVDRIRFIKRAQDLGFTLKEIAELLILEARPDHTSLEVRELAMKKLSEIETKLQDLNRLKAVLSDLTCRCSGNNSVSECPIIETLTVNAK
jgi:MerR family transcriptional regulator, copper efflux regulator